MEGEGEEGKYHIQDGRGGETIAREEDGGTGF